MADLDQLQQTVSALIADESTPFEFRDAFAEIEQATLTATNADVPTLIGIINEFRGKLPDTILLKPIRAKAKDIADKLMTSGLAQAVKNINDRNEALSSLISKLGTQINKANSDAGLLTQIKEGVEKATKTVTALKGLIAQLNATDGLTKADLSALVDTLGTITSIFDP